MHYSAMSLKFKIRKHALQQSHLLRHSAPHPSFSSAKEGKAPAGPFRERVLVLFFAQQYGALVGF